MSYIPVTQLRRDRKNSKYVINKKVLVITLFAIGVFSIV